MLSMKPWEIIGKKHPNKLVFVRKFQKVLGTWCVCTIHLDPLGTFQSEFQNQDLEAIGTLVVFASPWNYVCNMFIILLFSVGTCFEIDFIDKCLAIEPSPKLDYSVLGLEPMGVNCNVNGRIWISIVLTECSVEYCFICALLKATKGLTLDTLMYIEIFDLSEWNTDIDDWHPRSTLMFGGKALETSLLRRNTFC